MSIIGVVKSSGEKFNFKKFVEICRTWAFTFPVCGIISYIIAVVMKAVF